MTVTVHRIVQVLLLLGLGLGLLSAPASADPQEPFTPTVPTITGRAELGQTLTADAGSWPQGTTLTFEWFADGIPDATTMTPTLTVADRHADKAVSVRISGRDEDGNDVGTSERSSATLRVLGFRTPTITGLPVVGRALTAEPEVETAGTSVTYQWLADGKQLTGATGQGLTLTSRHDGAALSVRVTGSRAGYASSTLTSAATQRVLTVGTVRVSGDPAVGRRLTVTRGTWTKGATLRQRWYADGKAISGATGTSLTVPRSAVNRAITVRVTGSRSGYPTVSSDSGRTAKVQLVGKPKITTKPTIGKRVKAAPGTWTSGTRFRYQWYLGKKKISGATRSSLKVKSSWKGKRLTVKVTGTRSGYRTFTAASAASAKVVKAKPAKRPSRTGPISKTRCPSWAPIKGNANSGIYHVPGQRFYDATHPEDCFRTERAAVAAGYRRAKV